MWYNIWHAGNANQELGLPCAPVLSRETATQSMHGISVIHTPKVA